MNLQDQVLYRCVHATCGKLLPRQVNYCPYCGISQRDGTRASVPGPVAAPVAAAAAEPAVAAAPPPPAPPPTPAPPVAAPVEARVVAAAAAASASASAAAAAAAPPASAPPPAAPTRPAVPPRREPIRMRYWIFALLALWAIWMFTKPNKAKVEARIASAMALAGECKLSEAQGELIALRSTKATPEQLTRLQHAINDAGPSCEKKRARAKAWTDTREAVDKLIDDGENGRAQTRLQQFTRRYGEDAETRALKERIGPAREAAAKPPVPAPAAVSAPSGALARNVLSARRLIDEAERDIQVGNYQAAADKMQTCMTMIDGGSRECAAYKVHADRLQAELRRCLANRMEWVDHRCQ